MWLELWAAKVKDSVSALVRRGYRAGQKPRLFREQYPFCSLEWLSKVLLRFVLVDISKTALHNSWRHPLV